MACTTGDVLKVIGNRGVVVGSVAAGKQNPKDLDVVIRPRKPDERRNPVFADLLAQFKEHADSSAPGHVFIHCQPLGVEVFEDNGWGVDDEDKRPGQVTFRQAKRGAIERVLFGVPMLVQALTPVR